MVYAPLLSGESEQDSREVAHSSLIWSKRPGSAIGLLHTGVREVNLAKLDGVPPLQQATAQHQLYILISGRSQAGTLAYSSVVLFACMLQVLFKDKLGVFVHKLLHRRMDEFVERVDLLRHKRVGLEI